MRLPCIIMFFCITGLLATEPDSTVGTLPADKKAGYKIDQPGTITFTVGVKIKGKVEKPQVVIFLPKEKPQYREMDFSYSFQKDIEKPLLFEPIIE